VPVDSGSTERLDFAARWLRDGLAVLHPSLSVYQIQADMTNALGCLDSLRRGGVLATTTHLLVHATARALAANPAIHHLTAGSRCYRPTRVDLALSITGEASVAPVLVLEGADRMSVAEIASETARRAPLARQADHQLLAGLRRWGWLLPFGFMRRGFFRVMNRSVRFRMKAAGTFQVSTVPVDWALVSTFSASGVLVGGQVRSRVVVVDGQPAVRPMMDLTLSSDHAAWDGRAAAMFLSAVRTELESPRAELP